MNPLISETLVVAIRQVLQATRHQLQQTVNTSMVNAYWQIGRLIVEEEQKGQQRAVYGQQQLAQLSQHLCAEFGKGFDVSNLRNMRSFYQAFPKQDAVRPELSWTHYQALMQVEYLEARQWYLQG